MRKNTKLKILLFENRISQKQLSEDTGIPRAYLSLHLNGRWNFDEDQQNRIADALGCLVDDVFGEQKVEGWGKVKESSEYAGVSPRTLRGWFEKGLRFSRLPSGTVLIRFSWIDEYLKKFEVKDGSKVDAIVDEVIRDLS